MSNLFDPESVHTELIQQIEDGLGMQLVDPTNPYTVMLEAISSTTSTALQETTPILRKVYPRLCTSRSDILRHATETEMIGMYATPAITTITVFINGTDVLNNGTSTTINSETKKVRLSAGTMIQVFDTKYTLTNDVEVYFDGKNTMVEQTSFEEFGFNSLGSLESYIVKDNNNNTWIKFDLNLRQFETTKTTYDVIGRFEQDIRFKDKFWYLTATGVFNGVIKPIDLTYSEIVYQLDNPTLKVKVLDGKVNIELPNIYNVNNMAPDKIMIELHSTKGEININLSDFKADDYTFIRNEKDFILSDINVLMGSTSIVSGGSNPKSISEIKDAIITNVTGPLITPVTIPQLEEKAGRLGFKVKLYSDMATHRLFKLTKNIPESLFKNIKTIPQIFDNEVVISKSKTFNKIVEHPEATIIKKDCLFENRNNNAYPVENQLLLDTFYGNGGMSKRSLQEYLKIHQTFITPFTTIVYKDYETITYDLSSPVVDNIVIKNRNISTSYRLNIESTYIGFDNDTYTLSLKLTGSNILNLKDFPIRAQLRFKTQIVDKDLYVDSTAVMTDDNVLTFKMLTRQFVGKDNRIEIRENSTGLYETVDLRSEVEVMLFATTVLPDLAGGYEEESRIKLPLNVENVTGLTRQTIKVEFGKKLDDIFTSSTYSFTDRKYKQYEVDIPYAYDRDIYAFELDNDSADDVVVHAKNTPRRKSPTPEQVANNLPGDIIYIHRKGDPKLENGLPVVDEVNGIILTSNILMYEAEYVFTGNIVYDKTINLLKDTVKQFASYCLELNKTRLESTVFKYTTETSLGNVRIEVGDSTLLMNQLISPSIELYVDTNSDFVLHKDIVGRIIQKHLQLKVIKLDELRKDIAGTLNIKAASIKELIPNITSEYITVKENHFIMAKNLTLDGEVIYDINIKVIKV